MVQATTFLRSTETSGAFESLNASLDEQNSSDIMALLATVASLLVGVIMLALSIIPLGLFVFIVGWLAQRRQVLDSEQWKIFTCILSVTHVFVVLFWYFLLDDAGHYSWWYVLLASVLSISTLVIGLGIGTGIIMGFVGMMKTLTTTTKPATKDVEYAAVPADEHELEGVTAEATASVAEDALHGAETDGKE